MHCATVVDVIATVIRGFENGRWKTGMLEMGFSYFVL